MTDKRESYGHDMNNTDTVIVQQCKECGYIRFGKLTHGYHDDGYCMGDYATLATVPMSQIQGVLKAAIPPEWLASAAFYSDGE